MSKEVLSSVWLVPFRQDEESLKKTIYDLARKTNTVPFLPHLTIYGEVTAPIQEVAGAARQAVRNIEPFTSRTEKIAYTTEWSKTLIFQMLHDKTMDEIHRRLQELLRKYRTSDFLLEPPHISLVYKEEMTEAEKLKEIPHLEVPEYVTFDRIAVTTPTNPVEKWKDVAAWQTLFVLKLGS